MGRISASVELPATPEKMWAEFADPNNFEKWLTIHTKWKGDVPARFELGAQVSEVVTMLGMPNAITWTVDEYAEPSKLVISGTGMAGVKVSAAIDAEFSGQMIVGALRQSGGEGRQEEPGLLAGELQTAGRGLMAEGFAPAGLDRWTGESRFEVTRARLVEYAEATNDPVPARRAGDVASPVFAIVPVFQSLLEPALEVVPTGLFGRVVHGEQDFRFHRPIRPGDKLVSRAKMTGYEGLPNGTRGTVYLETRDEAGEPVNEQYVTLFVRGFDTGETRGVLGPDHRLARTGAAAAKVAQHVDDDQTFRYAPRPATGCRSIWTPRWLAPQVCPASSRMTCALWLSRRGRCRLRWGSVAVCGVWRCGSPSRRGPAQTWTRRSGARAR